MKIAFLSVLSLVFALVQCQEYIDYNQKAPRGKVKRDNSGLFFGIITGIAGTVLGSWFAKRRLVSKVNDEKKDLLVYMKLQDEIYTQRENLIQAEYDKLYANYQELLQDTAERDYEEFKAPDTDGDDSISKSEFNTYVKKYLSSFPELSEKDFPLFEEFDYNDNGEVSFDEWQTFLQIQKLNEKSKKQNSDSSPDESYQKKLLPNTEDIVGDSKSK